MIFGDVLFHELGHHIHHTMSPKFKEREDVAEEWSKKLFREYNRNRYSYLKTFKFLKPLFRMAACALKIASNIIEKRESRS
ncbi:MAG: hypothetical protein A2088_05855 [Nitrospirae bacterium GWD2_44_7]|nr:MAG: hypothetical protein A2088_05855 [Nitrospirae bacterium GWD2_44_7]